LQPEIGKQHDHRRDYAARVIGAAREQGPALSGAGAGFPVERSRALFAGAAVANVIDCRIVGRRWGVSWGIA
jgi:hypothetical protein